MRNCVNPINCGQIFDQEVKHQLTWTSHFVTCLRVVSLYVLVNLIKLHFTLLSWTSPTFLDLLLLSLVFCYDVAHTAARKQQKKKAKNISKCVTGKFSLFSPLFFFCRFRSKRTKVKTTNKSGTEIAQSISLFFFLWKKLSISWLHFHVQTFDSLVTLKYKKFQKFLQKTFVDKKEPAEQTSVFAFEPLWSVLPRLCFVRNLPSLPPMRSGVTQENRKKNNNVYILSAVCDTFLCRKKSSYPMSPSA